jgi:hypothetical protein
LGNQRDLYKKAVELDNTLHKGLIGDSGRDASLPGNLERKVRFCITRIICLLGNQRDLYKKAVELDNAFLRGPIGAPGGGFLLRGL